MSAQQLDLLFAPDTVTIGVARRGTPQERFEAFDAANPHVRRALVTLARRAVASGHRRIGMRMIWENLRWSLTLATTGQDGRKLNNDLAPWFARSIMAECPDLAGVFELRERRGDAA